MTEDFYDLLELSSDASQQEITSAYREKVRDYHPDVNDDDRAQAQFTALTKANEILSDPVERQAYDRLGHETYVSKRTSGIPSPDVWATTEDASKTSQPDAPSTASSDSADTDRSSTTTGGATTGSTARDSSSTSASTEPTDTDGGRAETSGSAGRSRTRSTTNRSTETDSRSSTESTPRSDTGSRTHSSSETKTTAGHETNTTASSTTATTGSSATTGSTSANTGSTTATAGSTAATAGSATTRTGSTTTQTGSATETAGTTTAGTETTAGTRSSGGHSTGGRPTRTGVGVVRWWRRRNVAMPLLWLSLIVYAAGVVHYALANESAIEALWAELSAAGVAPAALWGVLSSSRNDLETPLAFVATVEPVAPPLEPTLWYGFLAGIVGIAAVALLLFRFGVRSQPWGPITMDETIVLAVALALSTGLYGGPLLAGAALMPFLFGIVVHHTRRRPGWTPSSLYVVPVLGPAAGLAATIGGFASPPVALFAFGLCPLVGGLWLPLRATIRKHLGR